MDNAIKARAKDEGQKSDTISSEDRRRRGHDEDILGYEHGTRSKRVYERHRLAEKTFIKSAINRQEHRPGQGSESDCASGTILQSLGASHLL